MELDDEVKNLILKTSDSNAIKNMAVEKGMATLRQDGTSKVLNGLTTVEEVLRVTQK
jgi:general secretion pathway protein E